VFPFAFEADFQLEEQPPQPSKVPSHVPRSQSLSKVVERVYHLMKLKISFVCDLLIAPAGFSSRSEAASLVFEGSKRPDYFLVKE
jgi:hypothetical protein